MAARKAVFVCAAKRTPFGKWGGSLMNKTATELAAHAGAAAVREAGLKPEHVDHVVMGNVIESSIDGPYLGRHVPLLIGCPDTVPGMSVNVVCASGFEAIAIGSRVGQVCRKSIQFQLIQMDEADVVLAGGTEAMSRAPFVVRNTRFGTSLTKKYKFEDLLWEGLIDSYVGLPIGVTAELLGGQYKVTRQECDEFSVRSNRLYAIAKKSGLYKDEIEPWELKSKKEGTFILFEDEQPRETTIEQLRKMKSVFQKDGLITAGSASGTCDGAAVVVIASEDAVKKHNLKPMARLHAHRMIGCDPIIKGIGNVKAIRQIFKETGLSFDKMDIIEINEAFASSSLACLKELNKDGLELDRLNVNGGAIAMGHPLGATGARISGHICHELRRRKVRFGLGSACVGGGMGMAMIFENVAML